MKSAEMRCDSRIGSKLIEVIRLALIAAGLHPVLQGAQIEVRCHSLRQPVDAGLAQQAVIGRRLYLQAGPAQQRIAGRGGVEQTVQVSPQNLIVR